MKLPLGSGCRVIGVSPHVRVVTHLGQDPILACIKFECLPIANACTPCIGHPLQDYCGRVTNGVRPGRPAWPQLAAAGLQLAAAGLPGSARSLCGTVCALRQLALKASLASL